MSEFLHADDGPHDDLAVVNTPVAVHMSRLVVVERVDSSPHAALRAILRSGQRHLALVDHDGTFLGVVPADAVAASRRPTLAGLTASPALRVSPSSSMRHAASLMLNHGVDVVGVLDGDGQVLGVLRWSDIIEMVAGRGRP